VYDLVQSDRFLAIVEMAEELRIRNGSYQAILTEKLEVWRSMF
jgi:hypothetical protein